MKTKELIEQLFIADPIGDAEVVIGSGTDIWFVERQEWYYNGYPELIDWDEKTFDVKGVKILSEPDANINHRNKVSLCEFDVEEAIYDDPKIKITIDKRINKAHRDRYKRRFFKVRRQARELEAGGEKE